MDNLTETPSGIIKEFKAAQACRQQQQLAMPGLRHLQAWMQRILQYA
jgi:hypothetical protein